jgi:NAD(P)-dependent dehydrogenase (short-subunit alcohol dehydrogenase family)
MPDIEKEAAHGTLIVTGAGRGIGAAIAKLASVRGFSVAVNYAQDAHSATELVRHIARSGGRAMAIQADISREDEILRLFEAAERELGPLAGLETTPASPEGLRASKRLPAERSHRFSP